MKISLGEKGALLGLPIGGVGLLALLIEQMIIKGWLDGFINTLMIFIGLIVLAIFTSISYALASKKKEGILANYVYNMVILIFASALITAYMTWIAPRLPRLPF